MVRWRQRQANEIQKEGYSEIANNLPVLLQKFLISRGIDQIDADKIINPKLNLLKDPYLMKDMQKTVDRILLAFQRKEKICIYADFDLDGTSGLAIMIEGLKKLGFEDVIFYQPKRLSEGYGFHPHAVTELQSYGVGLIITVDVGITSYEAFNKAKELNLDVILTDHHLPVLENGEEILPNAFSILNPNQKTCHSGLGYLCGAGVAFYLIRALKRAFSERAELPQNEWDLKELLDFFCIGTLTDMVPLVDDNRVLVKHGMKVLEKTNRPGLRQLLDKLDLSRRELTSQDVSIKFAPKLNALSRMESDILPIHIYLEKSEIKAKDMIGKILENNQTRQSLQSSSEELALNQLKNWPYKDFVYVSSENFHRGIIGLIATKLSQEYQKPAFVGSLNSEGMIVGSARLPNGSDLHLVEALKSVEEELNRFGGHAAAAGFELHSKNEEKLIQKLNTFFTEMNSNPKEYEIEFDTEADLDQINQQFMKWHDHLGPYGMGFSVPVFRFNQLELHSLKELKGGHLKLNFKNDKNQIDALYFSPPEKKKKNISVLKKYDILGELQMNYFNKSKSVQILLKDIKENET